MRKASTPVLILLIILVLISLSVAGGGLYLYQQEKTKGLELDQKLQEITVKQKITETRLKDSEKLIADLQDKLEEAKSQIDSLNQDLNKEQAQRKESDTQLAQMKADLEEQKGFRADLEDRLKQAQVNLRKTSDNLKELDAKRQELEAKVKDLEEKAKQIELGKIVVSPEQAIIPGPEAAAPETVPAVTPASSPAQQAPAPVLSAPKVVSGGREGKILVINKDYNFVVINLGSKDGVKIGDSFSVYHSQNYIGDVKVEKVHDSMAAAGFVASDIKEKLFEGDKVVQNAR